MSGFDEDAALGGDFDVAFGNRERAEHGGGFDGGQKVVHFEGELIGEAVDIFAARGVGENFEQAGDAAGAGVRQHLIFCRGAGAPDAAGAANRRAGTMSGSVRTL